MSSRRHLVTSFNSSLLLHPYLPLPLSFSLPVSIYSSFGISVVLSLHFLPPFFSIYIYSSLFSLSLIHIKLSPLLSSSFYFLFICSLLLFLYILSLLYWPRIYVQFLHLSYFLTTLSHALRLLLFLVLFLSLFSSLSVCLLFFLLC